MARNTFQAVLGARLRRLRLRKGLRQDDVASMARAVGLDWTQGTVAAVETGRRSVSWLEGTFLQAVLGASLVDLLAQGRESDIGFTPARLRRIDQLMKRGPKPLSEGWARSVRGSGVRMIDEGMGPQRRMARRYGLPEDAVDITEMEVASFQTAERKAAEKLGVASLEVSVASFSLWGRSLTQERDRVFSKAQGQGDARVRRGHLTRELLRELEVRLRSHASGGASRRGVDPRPRRPRGRRPRAEASPRRAQPGRAPPEP